MSKKKTNISYRMDETITEREENKQITSDTSECKEATDTLEGMDITSDYNGNKTIL